MEPRSQHAGQPAEGVPSPPPPTGTRAAPAQLRPPRSAPLPPACVLPGTAHLPRVAPHFLMYFFCFVLEGRL